MLPEDSHYRSGLTSPRLIPGLEWTACVDGTLHREFDDPVVKRASPVLISGAPRAGLDRAGIGSINAVYFEIEIENATFRADAMERMAIAMQKLRKDESV